MDKEEIERERNGKDPQNNCLFHTLVSSDMLSKLVKWQCYFYNYTKCSVVVPLTSTITAFSSAGIFLIFSSLSSNV